MIRKYLKTIPVLLLALTLAACGSGKTDTAGHTQTAALKTVGALAPGQLIGSMDLVLTFPAGVSVATDSTGNVASGVVTITGVANPAMTMYQAAYTPASGTQRGSLHLAVINALGFGAGEFVSLKLNVAAGSQIVPGDFTLASFEAGDLNGVLITGLTTTLNAAIN